MNLSRVAVKQLTASDLSFFAPLLKRSKQKGINLNSDVFVDRFYPILRERKADRFAFRLTILGPGGKSPYFFPERKALRTKGAKNWRLNGAFVQDPPGDPGRFGGLQKGDFAVFGFEGATQPEAVTVILVSTQQDAALHGAIRARLTFAGRRSMVVVSPATLNELLDTTRNAYPDQHPLKSLALPDTVEEAVFGSAELQRRIAETDGRGVAVSPDTMQEQLRAAEETGRKGEAIFNQWLAVDHEKDDYEWVSRTHARATHDFYVRKPRWRGATGELFVDVKATRGAFKSPIHMSMAEVRWAASHPNHRVARIYGVGSKSPKLTMLSGIHEFASKILDTAVPVLPAGASIDGFEIDTTKLTTEFTADVRTPED